MIKILAFMFILSLTPALSYARSCNKIFNHRAPANASVSIVKLETYEPLNAISFTVTDHKFKEVLTFTLEKKLDDWGESESKIVIRYGSEYEQSLVAVNAEVNSSGYITNVRIMNLQTGIYKVMYLSERSAEDTLPSGTRADGSPFGYVYSQGPQATQIFEIKQ